MELLPRVLFEAPLNAPDADEGDGLVLARAAGGEAVLQLALPEGELRACSAARPPSITMEPEAIVALARAALEEWAPDLAAALEAHERRRSALRLVGGSGEPGGDAA